MEASETQHGQDQVSYYALEHVEPLHRYCAGGYHPLHVGDKLHARYEIIHKLGFGSYSTVWLARDSDTESNVAVKVCTADSDRPPESRILALLQAQSKPQDDVRDPAEDSILLAIDEFHVEGQNGSHHCVVTEPCRISLSDAREASYVRTFQLPVARTIVAQLVKAVAFLHGKGLVHGDLQEGNVLLQMPKTFRLAQRSQIYDTYGQPETEEIRRCDGKPLSSNVPCHATIQAFFGMACEKVSLADAQIKVCDFGESFAPASTLCHDSHTPLVLRAPEQLLTPHKPSPCASEIWSLACTIFKILGLRSLFEGWRTESAMITEHVDALGRMPKKLWNQWEEREKVFDDEVKRVDGQRPRLLRERIDKDVVEARKGWDVGEMLEGEARALEGMLRSMLAYDADARMSAQEVLGCEWMTKWALPDLERASELWGTAPSTVQDAPTYVRQNAIPTEGQARSEAG